MFSCLDDIRDMLFDQLNHLVLSDYLCSLHCIDYNTLLLCVTCLDEYEVHEKAVILCWTNRY